MTLPSSSSSSLFSSTSFSSSPLMSFVQFARLHSAGIEEEGKEERDWPSFRGGNCRAVNACQKEIAPANPKRKQGNRIPPLPSHFGDKAIRGQKDPYMVKDGQTVYPQIKRFFMKKLSKKGLYLEPLLASVVVSPLRLYGLHDDPRHRVARLLLGLYDLLRLRQAALVLRPVLPGVLFQGVPVRKRNFPKKNFEKSFPEYILFCKNLGIV